MAVEVNQMTFFFAQGNKWLFGLWNKQLDHVLESVLVEIELDK